MSRSHQWLQAIDLAMMDDAFDDQSRIYNAIEDAV
jgi:hypothetical protein